MKAELQKIASQFALEGAIAAIDSLGEGFINDTFIVRTEGDAPDYILQRKNKNIFPDVPAMMENIRKVTDHIRRGVVAEGGDPRREVMTIVPTHDGKYYFVDSQGDYWAVSVFIGDTTAYNKADSPELARKGGEGIGKFQAQLADFTEPLAEEYSAYLMQRGVVRNTVSFYMRNLRAVYNKAVRQRLAEQCFPFSGVYTGIDHTRKRAVDERLIGRLRNLDLSASAALALARDLFIFSYCTRGMAFVDMAFLRKRDLSGGEIHYVRRKTGQLMTVRLETCMREIIRRYEWRTRSTPYVFPLLTAEEPGRAYAQYQVALNYYNRQLKRLSQRLGFEGSLSSYTSRHSWATAARNHRIPITVISAGMGHTSEHTTRIYLSSLESSVIDCANRKILSALNRI